MIDHDPLLQHPPWHKLKASRNGPLQTGVLTVGGAVKGHRGLLRKVAQDSGDYHGPVEIRWVSGLGLWLWNPCAARLSHDLHIPRRLRICESYKSKPQTSDIGPAPQRPLLAPETQNSNAAMSSTRAFSFGLQELGCSAFGGLQPLACTN